MKHIEVTHQKYHLQGFSSDGTHMYWSFTDSIVKTTLDGTMRRQTLVEGGHLGDCDYYDGKVYSTYLGYPPAGRPWGEWSTFKVYVFDAQDLSLLKIMNLDICDYYNSVSGTDEDTRGFRGVDGICFAPDPETGVTKMFIACALRTAEKYSNQIILQFDTDGTYEKEYHIPTGNTVFGIQNLDYDAVNREFWFSVYGGSEPYMPKELLFCCSHDFKLARKYPFSSPYGIDCLGDRFICSMTSGKLGDYIGVAYECDESFFVNPHSEQDVCAMFGR